MPLVNYLSEDKENGGEMEGGSCGRGRKSRMQCGCTADIGCGMTANIDFVS
ncbi:MAG: hypothetical protein IPN29_08720 [Saprospiraceae bacterium]|nr:hypothetical protein [Saprospiraceae bacterium]